jgi:transposase
MKAYPAEIEAEMKKFHQTLSERDKRRYAAVEALKLGHGGIRYIAQMLGCDRNTVSEGIKDLQSLPERPAVERRVRRAGGGRKPYSETYPDIDEQFLAVLADHTAGDPMNAHMRWTNLSPVEIAARLAQQQGIQVSKTVIRQLLDKHGYRRRKAQKN